MAEFLKQWEFFSLSLSVCCLLERPASFSFGSVCVCAFAEYTELWSSVRNWIDFICPHIPYNQNANKFFASRRRLGLHSVCVCVCASFDCNIFSSTVVVVVVILAAAAQRRMEWRMCCCTLYIYSANSSEHNIPCARKRIFFVGQFFCFILVIFSSRLFRWIRIWSSCQRDTAFGRNFVLVASPARRKRLLCRFSLRSAPGQRQTFFATQHFSLASLAEICGAILAHCECAPWLNIGTTFFGSRDLSALYF